MESKRIEENKIYCADCLDFMSGIPDHSVDMILCDLPYGVSACEWDRTLPLVSLWGHYKRIIRPNRAIVLTARQPFTSLLVVSNLKMFKYEWVWDKHIPRNFLNAKIMPMQKHENVLVFGSGKIKYNPQKVPRDKIVKGRNAAKSGKDSAYQLNRNGTNGETRYYCDRNPDTIIVGCWEANAGKVHPTQKPVSLFEYLIRTYTDEGDLVLDNCIGSGTTALAAIKTNRRWIGIEKEEKWCVAAEKRISEYGKQGKL